MRARLRNPGEAAVAPDFARGPIRATGVCVTSIRPSSPRRTAADAENLILHRTVDHPGRTELVDAHAEPFREKGLAERHPDGAAFGQRLEPALGIGGVLD